MAVAVIIETPTKLTPAQSVGMVLTVFDYNIQRDLNKIGTFMVQIGVDEPLANQVQRGWRITIVEDLAETGAPAQLMYRGIVLQRRFVGIDPGASVLELTGYLRTQELAQINVHTNQIWTNQNPSTMAQSLAGYAVSNPGGGNVTVTFNEITRFAALLRLGEIKGWNLRENILNSDALQYISAVNLPAPTYTVQTLEDAGADLSHVHEMGIVLIAGTPTIEFIGDNIASRIIPTGTDTFDNPSDTGNLTQNELTLQYSTRSAPYAVQRGTNPDGTFYWYIEDPVTRSQFTDGVNPIELYVKRTDVQNLADNSVSRQAAANVLYDIAAQELMSRRSEFINFNFAMANGNHIWAQPGDAIRVEYEGIAYYQTTGRTSYIRLSRNMQVTSRTDKMGQDGEREVEIKVSSPAFVILSPSAPTNIILPAGPGDSYSQMDPYQIPMPYGSIPTATPSNPGLTDPGSVITDGTEPLPSITLGPSDLYTMSAAHYWRLPDGGTAWVQKFGGVAPPVSPSELSANTGGVLYHVGATLQISTDEGENWQTVILPHTGTPVDVKVSRSDGRTWLLIDDGTNVYCYVYDGTSWTLKLTLGGPLGYMHLGLSLVDPLRVCVTHVTGGGNGKAWYTTDGGTTWTDIGTTDPSIAQQQMYFFTNTNRMVALQAYTTLLKIEYSDTPYVLFPVDHTAISDATANVSGLTGRRWMLARDEAERGAMFAGIDASANRIFRSTDNWTTAVKCNAYPAGVPGLVGLQYDYNTDRLYALWSDGQCHYLPTAATRNFATVIAGDWVALPSVGEAYNQDLATRLALISGTPYTVPGEVF